METSPPELVSEPPEDYDDDIASVDVQATDDEKDDPPFDAHMGGYFCEICYMWVREYREHKDHPRHIEKCVEQKGCYISRLRVIIPEYVIIHHEPDDPNYVIINHEPDRDEDVRAAERTG